MGKKSKRLILLAALFEACRMLTGATSALYLMRKGILEREIAFLRMLQFIIVLGTDVSLGYIADKYSRRASVLLSVLCAACWLLITAVATHKSLLYVGETFNALSMALASGSFLALLIDTYKKEGSCSADLTGVIAQYRQSLTLSMAGGVLIGSFFPLEKLDHLWMMAGMLCACIFVGGCFLIEDDRKRITYKSKERLRPRLKDVLGRDVRYVLGTLLQKRLLFVCVAFLLSVAHFKIVISYTQIVTRTNLPHLNSSYLHATVLVLVLLAQSFACYVIKRHSPSVFSLASCTIGIFASLMISKMAYLNVGLWIASFFFLVSLQVSISSKIHNRVADELRGTVDSVLNAGSMVFASFFSWIVYRGYSSIGFIYGFSIFIFSAVCIANASWALLRGGDKNA